MKYVLENNSPVPISSGKPSNVKSEINASGIQGDVRQVSVTINVDHSYTSDLEISLLGPAGQRVLLVKSTGGSGNNFRDTTFNDGSNSSISQAFPPFRGVFRPNESLGVFKNLDPNGTWALEIKDRAFEDGGSLYQWSLAITTEKVPSAFTIQVAFTGGLTSGQQAVFQAAADRWQEIIVGNLPSVDVGPPYGVIDDVVIEASGISIDGVSGILGQAGPTMVRNGSFLPARGIMQFDTADLANMEANGSLFGVIFHEMWHVLGGGTIWSSLGLLQGAGTNNPIFLGPKAMEEFAKLSSASSPTPVPVANTGGGGTRDAHWREAVFGNELLTGFIDSGFNPISAMSIASMKDLGYEVDMNAADPYQLPSNLQLAMLGVGGHGNHTHDCCSMARPAAIVLPG